MNKKLQGREKQLSEYLNAILDLATEGNFEEILPLCKKIRIMILEDRIAWGSESKAYSQWRIDKWNEELQILQKLFNEQTN